MVGVGGVQHPKKIAKITTGPVGIFPEEYNPIGSLVTEILRDERTDGQTSCYFVLYIPFQWKVVVVYNLSSLLFSHKDPLLKKKIKS